MPKATSRSAARLCCPSSSERLRKLARPKAIASSSGPVFVGKTRAGDKTGGNMRQHFVRVTLAASLVPMHGLRTQGHARTY